MRAKWGGGVVLVVGAFLFTSTCLITAAHADTAVSKHHRSAGHSRDAGADHINAKYPLSKSGKARYARSGGGAVQCVPFARAASGIALKGNAANWWDAAAGVYQRGSEPEAGSVLNFRANGHMRLGHVAVVREVVGPREIEIDHANWASFGDAKGNISRGVRVIDVSADNDWSAVRVALDRNGDFGSVYRTYGFIYDRPDTGTMLANTPAETQPATDRPALGTDEVAEAPSAVGVVPVVVPDTGSETPPVALSLDAPDRGFR